MALGSPSRIPHSYATWADKEQPISELDRLMGNISTLNFARFKYEEGSGGLQTAVVTYKKKLPWLNLQHFLQVDLFSAVHFADKAYYDTLQKELLLYDCVLHEMITSKKILENIAYPSVTRRLNATEVECFNILRLLARVLSLGYQADCLNYRAENWLHADLDYETFIKLQTERGESFCKFILDMKDKSAEASVEGLGPWRSELLKESRTIRMPIVVRLIIRGVCAPVKNLMEENPELEALSRLDVRTALKIYIAKILTSGFSVKEKTVIDGERNKAATEALKKAISDGNRRIAILYGYGHMPDLDRRLREEFDLVPSQVEWITAWSIRNRKVDSHSFPFLKQLARISGWPLDRYQTLALLMLLSLLILDLWLWKLYFRIVGYFASWAATHSRKMVSKITAFM